jgi:hypothetical protein
MEVSKSLLLVSELQIVRHDPLHGIGCHVTHIWRRVLSLCHRLCILHTCCEHSVLDVLVLGDAGAKTWYKQQFC